MKLIYSILLSFSLITGCNGQTNIPDYIVKSKIPDKKTEYFVEDGVIKLDKSQKDETLPIAGRVCIKAVYNEKTKQFDIVPCK